MLTYASLMRAGLASSRCGSRSCFAAAIPTPSRADDDHTESRGGADRGRVPFSALASSSVERTQPRAYLSATATPPHDDVVRTGGSRRRERQHGFHTGGASGSSVGSLLPSRHFLAGDHRPQQTQQKFIAIRHFLSGSGGFSSLPPEEEEAEKQRIGSLTSYQKEMELRGIDADLARLQTLRGINTGELYTLRGKMKSLGRDYGAGFLIWWWTVWFSTACLTYAAIEVGGVDALALVARTDEYTGLDLALKLDPTYGTIALTLAVNEMLEPLRLPFVVFTTRPVVNFFK